MLTMMREVTQKNIKVIIKYSITLLSIWMLNLMLPFLSGKYLDYLNIESINICVFIFIIIAFTQMFQLALRYIQVLITTKLNHMLSHEVSDLTLQKIFRTEYKYYRSVDYAYFIDQITKDCNTIVNFVFFKSVNLILQILTIITSIVILVNADYMLSMIIIMIIPFYVITYRLHSSKIFETKQSSKEQANEYFSKFSEQINKLFFIKCNQLEKEMQVRFKKAFDRKMESSLTATKTEYVFYNLNQLIISFVFLCIMAIGGYRVLGGALTIGYFSIINTYFKMLIGSVNYLLGFAGIYQDTKISGMRLEQIFNAKEDPVKGPIPKEINMIEMKKFSISYENNIVIDNLNYTFIKGKIYVVAGKNGTGKTTLLNALAGMLAEKYSGEISYDGINIENINLPLMRRKRISYLEQVPTQINISVSDYLRLGIDEDSLCLKTQEKLITCLGMREHLLKNLNESGNNFSGGEKQKLAIVRVLSKKSNLVLLDEPTSALDKKSCEKLMKYLLSVKKEIIIVIASHDPTIISQCDELIEL